MGTGNIGFEEKLWEAADKLRGSMDSGEYKHIVLGLIFLKYISDKFENKHAELVRKGKKLEENRNEYETENIFWVPVNARWKYIEECARYSAIGQIIDNAMISIEKENISLKGVLEKRYARPEIDKRRLGELIDLVSSIKLTGNKEKDILGRIYEYFLGEFASDEGKGGGEFYTPTSVVKTLVSMIEPYKGKIYDPCCGSGGMFIQSENFVENHKGKLTDLSIHGQELNSTTWKLCKMNLAIRGLEGNLGKQHDDTFHNDLHHSLRANYILANPPFNIKDWGGEHLINDERWQYGIPAGNANYAWLQHIVHHLCPNNGVAGVVLANGALSTEVSNGGEIRKNLLKDNLVDSIVSMPDKLFYSTGISVSLWILRRKKDTDKNEVLFIDARNLGTMVDRAHRELTDRDIEKISKTYINWKADNGKYKNSKGFCKVGNIKEIEKHNFILTPSRYVGIKKVKSDGEPFEKKMERLTKELSQMFVETHELEEEIKQRLGEIGYDI